MAFFPLPQHPLKHFLTAVLLILGCAMLAWAQRAPRSRPMNSATSTNAYRVLIKKAARQLIVYRNVAGQEQVYRTYSMVLGRQPVGHKRQQGDGATPEGDYFITHHNPKSNYYLSLGVSYPNAQDAAAGLRAKLITQTEHDAIVAASRQQAKPLQNTRLGGDIFIHGGGTGSDWTLGCVALENQDMKELFELLPVRTPVRIVP